MNQSYKGTLWRLCVALEKEKVVKNEKGLNNGIFRLKEKFDILMTQIVVKFLLDQ